MNKKVAAFQGYSKEQEAQCKLVGEQYIRELTALRKNFMSVALMAVGDPSLLRPAVAAEAPSAAEAPAAAEPPVAQSETEPEDSGEEQEWDTGEGWEIPEMTS